ncbi:MAG: hypothetical protein LYZ66_06490 [Nitrososphaerales archaeon]|nr:hypothetical protein [Nitrososphaerales archaeon]
MQSVQQDYATLKTQLEEKIANLKRERDTVLREVESLSQRLVIKELERQAKSLEGEMDGLKGKRSIIEQKLASLDAPPPTQQRPSIGPVSP